MNKIGIVSVYFGQLPNYINVWMESAKKNNTIDFYIVNDRTPIPHPENVHFIKMTLEEFSQLAAKKINLPILIKSPYKCCDFKVAYGLILEDYLKDYDFWGHCDLDLIWGDLRHFLSDQVLNKYDRIFPLGHLSLYRNTEQMKYAFTLEGSLKGDYKQIFLSDKHFAFDELGGMYQIMRHNAISQYDSYDFADISPVYKQMKIVTKYTNYENNYKHQIFVWDTNRIIRYYIGDDGNVNNDEFAYLHLQKRKYNDEMIHVDVARPIMINSNHFINCDADTINETVIKRNNRYNGKIYEYIEWKKRNWNLKRG